MTPTEKSEFLQNYAKLQNKREDFTEKYALRLQNVQIECCDALHVINVRDTDGSFFYLDPPYFQAIMGHYGGYTARDFEDLLLTLFGIKGKFLLSSYPSELLAQYVGQNRWHSVENWRAAYQLQRTEPHSKNQKSKC